MSKKKSVILLIILTMVITFTATVAASTTGLLDGILNTVKTDVQQKTDANLTIMNGVVQNMAETELSAARVAQTDRAIAELDSYYKEKMATISTNPEFNASLVEASIKVMQYTTTLIADEKARIDAAIAAALAN
jgi:hypothetical protein